MSELALFGHDLFGEPIRPPSSGPLAARFEFPPFSVLNARDGNWQDRKRAWLSLGIEGEIGRGMVRPDGVDTRPAAYGANEKYNGGDAWRGSSAGGTGASVFDPVLCELAYRWFCPPGGQVIDPFAGGSVRGVVAGLLGYRYHGIELRRQQTVANETQKASIAPDAPVSWVCGDSMDELQSAPLADFVFSCPPYGDLERYSEDERDLSTMEYHTFLAAYKRIILRCSLLLKPGCLACFVVGDFRDRRTGMYRGFVADTINAFRDVGLELYNDAVLVTAVGSLPVRVGAQFAAGRKLGKTHQNVLVFANGQPPRLEEESQA